MSSNGNTGAAKSLVGPLEELYLVAFIADGEEQAKIEKALRAWADKWLCSLRYDHVVDNKSMKNMTPALAQQMNTQVMDDAKKQMGQALVQACGMYIESPINDLPSIQSGNPADTNLRQYSMLAVRRWDK